MSLSVLMPAFNERDTIRSIVELVLAQSMVAQVVIVDDGSTDGTQDILRSLRGTDPRLEVIFQSTNQGKGAAVRKAISRALHPVTIIQDADLEYTPSDYEKVIEPILRGSARVVYGSRVLNRANDYPIDTFRIGSFMVTQWANLLFSCRLTDEPTCYKAFDTAFLKSLPLRSTGFELCPELTAWTRRRGEQIVEVPISYSKRSIAEGKKIRWVDGVTALTTLTRLRFTPDPSRR